MTQSSCFSHRWTYDVFLSFRGEDIRTGFAGNLYNALCQRGIHTFMDDHELERGEEIPSSLCKAIKESRNGIVIFSKNYASSTYCLDELVHMLEFIKGEGRSVWPVFYDVNPSQVRHQKGSYGEALARHEEILKDGNGKEKVKKWRLALSHAANLSGQQLKQGNEYEYEFIGRITEQVSIRINRTPLHVANHPVGLEARVLKVNSLLDVGSNDRVSMVGICGIGGIGKTTTARAVYNLIGDQFEGLCFLSNVREVSDKHGLVHLQETLLNEIVGEKDIRLGDVNKGVSVIKHRLCRKRVLLVLDDVDKPEQLQAIIGRCDWFGCGSRIIITTRDKRLLNNHGVELIYDAEELNNEEALQLFTRNAFGGDEADSSYLDISNRVVCYSCGLPLALEVIGSNFCGKRINEWISALDEYERIPDAKILKILKLSFDALEDNEKEIFLDVACFFKGDNLEDVKDMLLRVRDIKPEFSIGMLIDKSLIKIEHGRVTMHDLIQDMGRAIIRQESPKDPGSRSRLWLYKDILRVLKENMGTDKIEALILDLPRGKEVHWSGMAFKKMRNLRMLIIRNACFSRPPKHLPNSLRVLDWRHYPWKFLPSDFHPTNLVNLSLTNSSCVLLKPLTKKFESLSVMNFSNSKFLRQVPDLSGIPNLKELCLDDCPKLTEIHDSVGFLGKLRFLSAERCTNLSTFPLGIKLTSLECLRLAWCSRLKNFPEVLEKMENITELSLAGTAIEELPHSVCNLTGLQTIDLVECKCLKQLSISTLMLPTLRMLEAKLCRELRYFSKREGEEGEGVSSAVSSEMKLLSFFKCNLSDDSLSICLSCLPNLTNLDLSFNSLTILPACIKECRLLRDLSVSCCRHLRLIEGMPPNLETFKANNCTSLTEIHDSVGFLVNLRFLSAERCTNLRSFSHGIKLTSLECLRLSWCSRLQSFPEVLEKMENITELSLSGTAIEELPHSFCNLTGLRTLDLVECRRLKQLPTSVLMLPKLWILGAKLCTELRYFSKYGGEGGGGVSSVLSSEMKFLSFSKCNLSDDSLYICLSCLPNLTYLNLSFNSFTILPACIKECRQLRDLSVEYCKQLRQVEGMPPKLETFKANNCTSLTSLSSSILLNQAFHRPGRRKFILPGQKVPKWFHHHSNEKPMCFWVRKEFPSLVVCVVVGVLEDKDCRFNLKLSVRINGIDQIFYSDQGLISTLEIDHIFLFDLQSKLPKDELEKLLLQDQWNHVEVLCTDDSDESWISLKGGVIKWSGVHVYQPEKSMENIRFSRPSSPKRTYHDFLSNSNNDMELDCYYPLMKKQHISLDMGVCDFESLDMQQQQGCCATVSRHKGKDLLVCKEGNWLSMRPCWQEPLDCVNCDSNSKKSASTNDAIIDQDGKVLDHLSKSKPGCEVTKFPVSSNIQASTTCASSGKVIGGELHETTSSTVLPTTTHGSPRNHIELTSDDIEMEAFYASLDGDLTLTGPSEETMRALETLQDLLSRDFSVLLHQGQYSTMKTTLEYLSNLSADGGVGGEMQSVILELSREFPHWSGDYGDASRKVELTTASLLKADKLEDCLGVNLKCYREVKGLEDDLCNELVCLEKRKKQLEEETNTIQARISVSQSEKDMAAKRKRDIYEVGKTLRFQRDKSRQQVPRLRDEQESAKETQAKIKAEWSKLAEKFNKTML